ncbi:MAG: SGNH/GDSL hydrolase family protein [Byssovorax sp.]
MPKPSPTVRLRRAASRAALVLGSISIALGIGEIVARIAFKPARSISWYHYDLRYGFRHREDADATTNEWGDGKPWRFRTNARGFRGPDWPDAPPPSTTRVLVMGDSFTFGNAVDEEGTYPRVAGATAGPGWEVRNAGVSAWGPQNALAYLETEGESIGASCLVYGFFEGNDVMDGVVHPFYRLEGGEAKPIPITAPPPSRLASVRDVMRKVPLYDFLLEHSQLFNVLRSAGLNTLAKHDQTAPAQDLYNTASRDVFDQGLALNDAALDRMLALARKRFGAFALVLIPMRGQVTPDRDAMAVPFPLWMAEASHARALAWAKAHDVPVVDLGEALAKSPAEAGRAYFARDFHLGPEGNQLLGKLLGERLPAACAKQP